VASGSVVSVNVARPREIEWLGRRATTSIWKEPVAGRVHVERLNLAGDRQADPRFHGGPDKAVYAYAREDYDWWADELGGPLADATFGENLTLRAVDITAATVGERWQVGSTLLEVTGPRTPCWKLGARMGSVEFPVHFAAAGRPGAYFRVLTEGTVEAGDEVRIVGRPTHGLTVGRVAEIYHGDRSRCEELLRAPEIGEEWRGWANDRLAGEPRVLPG
jgi:MOSC domain-containing protein YiiM